MQNEVTIERKVGGDSLNELSRRLEGILAQLQKAKEECVDVVGRTAALAIEAGEVLQRAQQLDLPGFDYRTWAEDHGIKAADAVRYVSVAERYAKHKKLDDVPIRQMLQAADLLPETSGRAAPPDQTKTLTFQSHLNKLAQWFTEDRVASIDPFVRQSVAKQLRELLVRLEGKS